jgi:hypothetical protein
MTTVYNYKPETFEYMPGEDAEADLCPIEETPMLPALATFTKPPTTVAKGKVLVFDESAETWSKVEDHRGLVFNTETLEPSDHVELGVLPEELTNLIPADNFHIWNGSKWVPDTARISEYDGTKYARDRAEEYSKLNQDEMRYDDMLNGTTEWFDTITAIKVKYPKP